MGGGFDSRIPNLRTGDKMKPILTKANFLIANILEADRRYLDLFITEKHTAATDGHMVIRVSNLEDHSNLRPSEFGKAPEKLAMSISKEASRKIEKSCEKFTSNYSIQGYLFPSLRVRHEQNFLDIHIPHLDHLQLISAQDTQSKPPKFNELIREKKKKNKIKFRLNVRLLLKLLQSFKKCGIKSIDVSFSESDNDPLIVEGITERGQNVLALLMPMQID